MTNYYRKITGERLYLSPLDPNDETVHTKWAEWMNDRSVADYFDGFHTMFSQSSAKKLVEGLQGYRFLIITADNDALIGQVSLHNIDHLHRNAFLGILIGEKDYRNRGYGTEAIRLALEYGFKTLNLHNIMLSVLSDNTAGIACYKKVGFKEAGCGREWVFKNGKYVDKLYMDLLDNEFTGDGG